MKQLVITLTLLALAMPALATYRNEDLEANASAEADAIAESVSSAVGEATAAAEASNEGNELSVNSTYESGPADLIMVPNSNSENCLRVFGFAFGNDSASGMIGFPWRSNACDFEQAADDAFAAGERELGWYWKCHNRSLYKTFKDKGEAKELAIEQCHTKMVGEVTNMAVIKRLKEELAFLQEERRVERIKCAESKARITSACYGGK